MPFSAKWEDEQDEEVVFTGLLLQRQAGCSEAPDAMGKYIDSPAPRDALLAAESLQHSAATGLDDRDDI